MATNQSKAPDHAAENNRLDGPSTQMLNDATHGQTLDPERDGQQNADQMDDSMRSEMPSVGPDPASDENLPRELTKPSDVAFTLPEMHDTEDDGN
jgi:hypothetical protein